MLILGASDPPHRQAWHAHLRSGSCRPRSGCRILAVGDCSGPRKPLGTIGSERRDLSQKTSDQLVSLSGSDRRIEELLAIAERSKLLLRLRQAGSRFVAGTASVADRIGGRALIHAVNQSLTARKQCFSERLGIARPKRSTLNVLIPVVEVVAHCDEALEAFEERLVRPPLPRPRKAGKGVDPGWCRYSIYHSAVRARPIHRAT